mgnify:CR=1 FL=1
MTSAFEQLNDYLKQAEEVTPRLREANAEQILAVVTGLDGAKALVDQLITSGARYPAEEVQRIEMIESALRKHMGRVSRTLAAAGVSLEGIAAERAQVPDAWWWKLPELVRQKRAQTLRTWLIWVGVAVVVVVIAAILYNTVFAPDPIVLARTNALQQAQQLVIEENDLQGALDAVNAGLAEVERLAAERGETPETVELLTTRGVILEAMGDAEAGARDFAAAEAEDRWAMLTTRAQLYLYYIRKPDAALADAEALVEMEPDHPAGYMFLGDAYGALGQRLAAYDAYEKAKSLAFENEEYASLYVLVVQKQQALIQQPAMPSE